MKILMIMPVSIGDIVLTTPAIEAVKLKYPQSILHYAVQKGSYSQVLENNPHIDELILLTRDYLEETQRGNYRDALREELGDRPAYDLVIHFRNDDGRVAQRDLKNRHVAYYFAKKAGVGIDSIQPRVYIDEEHASEATRIIEQLQPTKETKLIVLSPYCGFSREIHSKRKWSIDNFIFLMNKIEETHKARFVIIGAKNDPPVERDRAISLMGYSLMTVASVISRCDLFIGIDSGVTHIAAAFDIPIIDVLFPGLPESWRPANDRHVVFSSRRKIRNYTNIEDLKREQVLKYCRLFLADPRMTGRRTVRFYPRIGDIVRRMANNILVSVRGAPR